MERRWWMAAGLGLALVGACAVAITHKSNDELAFLVPYVVAEEPIEYWSEVNPSTRPPTTDYFLARNLTLQGVPATDFDKIAAPHLNASTGWVGGDSLSVGNVPLGYFGRRESSATQESMAALIVDNAGEGKTAVIYQRRLSWFEVLIIRIKHFGRNPFKG